MCRPSKDEEFVDPASSKPAPGLSSFPSAPRCPGQFDTSSWFLEQLPPCVLLLPLFLLSEQRYPETEPDFLLSFPRPLSLLCLLQHYLCYVCLLYIDPFKRPSTPRRMLMKTNTHCSLQLLWSSNMDIRMYELDHSGL